MDKPKIKLPVGTGVYETIAVVHRKPAFLDLHLDRLERGAEWLAIPRARERVLQMIVAKLGACPDEPTALRAEAPGHGIPGTSHWPRLRDVNPGQPVGLYYPKTGKARGLEDTIKHSQRAAKTTARNEAKSAGCWDAVVVNDKGVAAEATVCNVFAVLDGRLATPGDDLFPLPGVARAIVLEEAAKAGIPVDLKGLTFEDLTRASEVFLTNSLVGVLPVDFILHADGPRHPCPPSHERGLVLAAAFRAREEADLTTAPGPADASEA
jgi:branched-subunit amino acid aminotransferase/4-amino-4-deoxychorismate lyase